MTDREYQALYDEVHKELVTETLRKKLGLLTAHAADPTIEELTAARDSLQSRLTSALEDLGRQREVIQRLERERDEARRFLAAEQEQCSRLGANNVRLMKRLGVEYPNGLESGIERLEAERDNARLEIIRIRGDAYESWGELGALDLREGDVIDADDVKLYRAHVEALGRAVSPTDAGAFVVVEELRRSRDLALRERDEARNAIHAAADRYFAESKQHANTEYGKQCAAVYRALVDIELSLSTKAPQP